MPTADKVLKKMIVTEKATDKAAHLNQYTFEVFRQADKKEIAAAIEETFGVTVTRVNTLQRKPKAKPNRMQRGRLGFEKAHKKAFITLKEGDSIEIV